MESNMQRKEALLAVLFDWPRKGSGLVMALLSSVGWNYPCISSKVVIATWNGFNWLATNGNI
jgi:hypothetical protein